MASSDGPSLEVLDVHEGSGHECRLRRRGQVERLGVVVHIVGVGVHHIEQAAAAVPGLTLVRFSPQRKHLPWDMLEGTCSIYVSNDSSQTGHTTAH
jgi:hypothetical protein